MHYSLIRQKKIQLEAAEKSMEKATHHYEILYLKKFINSLKSDLFPPVKEKMIVQPQENIIALLQKTGLVDIEIPVFAYLLLNKPLEVGQICNQTQLDRGKTYRAMNHLMEKDLVVKIPGTVSKFAVFDMENPLQGMIDLAKNTHKQYVLDNKKVLKFMTDMIIQ